MASHKLLHSGLQHCPLNSQDWDSVTCLPTTGITVKRDIVSLYEDPAPGIFFVSSEQNFMCVHAMIVGNFDTPYEGGFFHFYVRFGPTYPYAPPRVCSMSCYRFGETVRFNPKLYENGAVSHNILDIWSPANNLGSVLMSIQTLFVDQALCNELGFSKYKGSDEITADVDSYDLYVLHETLRVSVLHTIVTSDEYKIPAELVTVMKTSFFEYYDYYLQACDDNAKHDGTKYRVTLREELFEPIFKKLKESFIALRQTLEEERPGYSSSRHATDTEPEKSSNMSEATTSSSEDSCSNSSPGCGGSSSSPSSELSQPQEFSKASEESLPTSNTSSPIDLVYDSKVIVGGSDGDNPKAKPSKFGICFGNSLDKKASSSSKSGKQDKDAKINKKLLKPVQMKSVACDRLVAEVTSLGGFSTASDGDDSTTQFHDDTDYIDYSYYDCLYSEDEYSSSIESDDDGDSPADSQCSLKYKESSGDGRTEVKDADGEGTFEQI